MKRRMSPSRKGWVVMASTFVMGIAFWSFSRRPRGGRLKALARRKFQPEASRKYGPCIKQPSRFRRHSNSELWSESPT
ncbi:hypothetical protein GQ53DRAFT_87391 [Thozetella sp. PMI_491]|nr:hypothetical protein GQ53DRAFT_87391 [Thozetella sp. PMI_491]